MLGNIGTVNGHFHSRGTRIMADLKAQFEKAVAESKSLPEKPDNMTLLKIYALYKQGSAGDVDGKRPGFTDMVGRAKWDAWNEVKGTSGDAVPLVAPADAPPADAVPAVVDPAAAPSSSPSGSPAATEVKKP